MDNKSRIKILLTAIIGALVLAPLVFIINNLHKIIIFICIILVSMKILGIFDKEETKESRTEIVQTISIS